MGSRRLNGGFFIAGLVLLIATLAGGAGSASSATTAPTDTTFIASLNGAQEVPPSGSGGTGSGTVVLNVAETMITVNMNFSGLGSNANAAHIHGPAPPGVENNVVFGLAGVPAATSGAIPEQTFTISAAQVADLKNGLYYFNVHTTNFSGGEIRGQITQQPTAVRIASAKATRTPRGVLVRWRTATETQTLGFNVYRLQPGIHGQQIGKLMKLNRTLIRSLGSVARGHAYSWLDRNARGGRVTYRLQAVGRDGTRAWLSSAVAA